MKLQYLGDARDAFKWDFLHWICTKSSKPFGELVFMPMLTYDDKNSNEGQIHHSRFECREFIRPFIESLKQEPRSLEHINKLGTAENGQPQFRVTTFTPTRYISRGTRRNDYWHDFDPEKYENAVVFFDPDNGFETKTKKATKWIRHDELKFYLSKLPKTSVIVVYQHRPRRTWGDLFADLTENLGYAHTAVAAYESDLAFVAMAGNEKTGHRIHKSIKNYADLHLDVCCKKLK